MIDCDERPGRPTDRTVCGDRRITWSRLAGAVVDAPDSATPSWCVWPWHKCCWDSTSSIGGSGSPHTRIRGGRTSRPPRSGLQGCTGRPPPAARRHNGPARGRRFSAY